MEVQHFGHGDPLDAPLHGGGLPLRLGPRAAFPDQIRMVGPPLASSRRDLFAVFLVPLALAFLLALMPQCGDSPLGILVETEHPLPVDAIGGQGDAALADVEVSIIADLVDPDQLPGP